MNFEDEPVYCVLCDEEFLPKWHHIVCNSCVETGLISTRDLNELINFEIAGVGLEGLRMTPQELTKVLGFDPTVVSPTSGLD